LNQNEKCRVSLFCALLTGGVCFEFPVGDNKLILTPLVENGNLIEHIMTIETSAIGIPVNTTRFKMKFRTDNQGPPVTLEEI
jgi:hypothetical protein